MTSRLLVAYSTAGIHVQTTADYIAALKKYSGYEVDYLHVTHDADVQVDLNIYDVVFHNYCSRLCFAGYVSKSYQEKLRAFRGVKVLAVQDEYDQTNVLKAAIKNLGFDIVLTCVPQEFLEYVYPRAEFPSVQFITVLTGYVFEGITEAVAIKPLSERPIFLGYRGRDIGAAYGRLGFDKVEIGRGMKRICDERGIVTDIAWDEHSRIYGHAWQEFVGNCRAMLGAESGSNIFDFDGSIRSKLAELTRENGGRPPSYYDFLPFIEQREREIDMGQISPRVFECALTRTPMVLFRGRYSDAIFPEEHYIILEKDFSNADEVLRKLEDLTALTEMAERAYVHLVGSGKFSYATFCESLTKAFTAKQREKNWLPRASAVRTISNSPRSLADLKKLILRERPMSMPGASSRFYEQQAALTALNYLNAYKDGATVWRKMREGYSSTFNAHLALLNALASHPGSRVGKGISEDERALVENIAKVCEQIFAAAAEHGKVLEEAMPKLLAIKFDGVGPEARVISDTIAEHGKAWIDCHSAFFDVIGEQTFALHDAIRRRIRIISRTEGASAGLGPWMKLLGAMFKAPIPIMGVMLLWQNPTARQYIRKARRLIHRLKPG